MKEEQAALVEYRQAQADALAQLQAAERAGELRGIIAALDRLALSYRPEEAGAALARITGEARALAVLRDTIGWLRRVLTEAEQG